MLGFLSNAARAVFVGDDDGLFDLATAETFIQGLEEGLEDEHYCVDTLSSTSATGPQLETLTTTSLLQDFPKPLPEAEEVSTNSELPVVADNFAAQDITDSVQIFSDIRNDQNNIICVDTPAAASDDNASFIDGQGGLGQGLNHNIVTSSKNTEIVDAEALNNVPVDIRDELDDSVAPDVQTTNLISPFKSLKDIVLEPERDDEAEVLSFEYSQSVDALHDTTHAPSGIAARHEPAPVPEITIGKKVKQSESAEALTSPLLKSKPSDKKKGGRKGRRCKKCKERGHLGRDCPGAERDQQQPKAKPLPLEQHIPPEGHEQEPALPATVPVVAPPEAPSRAAQSIRNWLSVVLGTPILLTENDGDSMRPTVLSLFGQSELKGECSTEPVQHGNIRFTGPSSLICHEKQQNLCGLLGPSCLTKSSLKHPVQQDDNCDTQPTSEVLEYAKPDAEDHIRNDLHNFLQSLTLTEQRLGSLSFGVLGPQILTKNSFGSEQLNEEHTEPESRWDSDETIVSSIPKRGLLEIISGYVPWFGSRRRGVNKYARDELLALRPSMEVTQPTSQSTVEERYQLVVQSKDRSLRVQSDESLKIGEQQTAVSPSDARVPAVQAVQGSQSLQDTRQRNRAPKKRQKQKPPKEPAQQPQETSGNCKPKVELVTTSAGPKETRHQKVNKLPTQPPPLPFTTITAPHIEAWSYASMAYSSPAGSLTNEFGPHNLVMWTDATAPELLSRRLQALSVTYRQPQNSLPSASETDEQERQVWRDWAFTADVDRGSDYSIIDVLETMAVEVAVGIAVGEADKAREAGTPIRKVTVFTDSQNALASLRCRKSGGQARPIEGYVERLRGQGVRVELRWVPGHACVPGNERADRLALLASKYAPAPERKGGMVRVPVPLLRVCERQVARMEVWSRGADQSILRPFMDVQRRELKEALRTTGMEEGWLAGSEGRVG
ncbi:hypothetical protein BR93DRAFT_970945 [Coniochaeta sp. PMI_546]|nr:hypothetical protein BR93DRAFT_970945 [Coniochaeta sp. PMI_546]